MPIDTWVVEGRSFTLMLVIMLIFYFGYILASLTIFLLRVL